MGFVARLCDGNVQVNDYFRYAKNIENLVFQGATLNLFTKKTVMPIVDD